MLIRLDEKILCSYTTKSFISHKMKLLLLLLLLLLASKKEGEQFFMLRAQRICSFTYNKFYSWVRIWTRQNLSPVLKCWCKHRYLLSRTQTTRIDCMLKSSLDAIARKHNDISLNTYACSMRPNEKLPMNR
jgi:hypothetical protein